MQSSTLILASEHHPPAAGMRGITARLRASSRSLAWLLLLVFGGLDVQGQVSKEYQIKAAFLYNFTKFVDWPAERFAEESTPLVIGVFGKNPFGAELRNVVKDRKLNGREIVVKQVDSIEEAGAVHVLFIAATEDGRVARTLAALQGKSILTVGESELMAKAGGIINFVLEGDKVRFEINATAAEKGGMKVSAQLLKLAKTVRKQN